MRPTEAGSRTIALANRVRRNARPRRSGSSWTLANALNSTEPATLVNTVEGNRISSYARW